MNAATGMQFGRLAFRVEGQWWVAYLAKPESMDGADELARVRMSLVGADARKFQFLNFVRDVFADIIEERLGFRPEFTREPQLAPEHERSGNA